MRGKRQDCSMRYDLVSRSEGLMS
ncbi:hypothetical protein Gorai_007314, partial [Gossypium raimondii]|nr:hypothetical protein [Gossypium raimondii]